MNAITAQTSSQDNTFRNDAIRRRNAETAYNSSDKYKIDNKKTVESLENLLIAKKEVNVTEVPRQEFNKLGAGQMKQVALPIGKTLEETINLWQNVRTEAISIPQPTTADYQLAATASSKIRQVEVELGLHQQTMSRIETAKSTSMELPMRTDRETLIMEKRYEKAITSYSFQVDMHKNDFKHESPSFQSVA